MPVVVKIIRDDDGNKVDNPKWHLAHKIAGGSATLCTGEFYGFGESSVVYKEKDQKPGNITCEDCKNIIKWMKTIKL